MNDEIKEVEDQWAFTIIVNGRKKEFSEKAISFSQIVRLAFSTVSEDRTTIYTVTYKNGPKQNPEGSMVKGDSVYVKTGMIFNVTATDKS